VSRTLSQRHQIKPSVTQSISTHESWPIYILGELFVRLSSREVWCIGGVMHSRHELNTEVTNYTQWVNHSLCAYRQGRCDAFTSRTKYRSHELYTMSEPLFVRLSSREVWCIGGVMHSRHELNTKVTNYTQWVNHSLCAYRQGRCDAFTSPTKNTRHHVYFDIWVTNSIWSHEQYTMSEPLFVSLFSREEWCIHVTN